MIEIQCNFVHKYQQNINVNIASDISFVLMYFYFGETSVDKKKFASKGDITM